MLYYCRASLIIVYFIFFALLANLLALLRPFHPNNSSRILKWFKPAYKLGNIKVDWRYPSNTRYTKPVIYIANHQDLLDIFLFSQCWPENTIVIGKKSLLWMPFFGTAFWLCGNLLIDRKNKNKAWGLMDKVVNYLTEKQNNILFMPEGTRSRGKGLLPFKQGAFSVAIRAKVDIVPICASSTDLINLNEKHPKTAIVEFLPPINTDQYTETQAQELAEYCHQIMARTIQNNNEQIKLGKV